MSGHSKWSTIKNKKAATDAKRGQAFSRLSKEVTLAAKSGGKDLDMNPRLRTAVAAAKAVNMPNDNIERAIKKGTGELQGAVLEEIMYEGYAPGGVGVLVCTLTDNRNRTAANVRSTFTKHNGSMAAANAVAWQFHRKSRFVIEGEHANEDKLMELLLDSGADVQDIIVSDGMAEIFAAADAFAAIAQTLEKAKIPVSESSIPMLPETPMVVTDPSLARQAAKLIEILEEDDEVQAVYSNLEISDEVAAKMAEEG
jgi:YebC/PmpR family DNA-binding regulatory protein